MGHQCKNVSLWWTFGGGSKLIVNSGSTAPSVSLLPPSPLQLSEGSASLLCLLSGYSPQGALVSWTVDGSEVTNGVLTSTEEEKSGRYSRSSTLTLSKDFWEKGEEFSCKVSHNNANHPVTNRKINSDDQCDERVGLAVDSVLCVVLHQCSDIPYWSPLDKGLTNNSLISWS
ncbi:hypothetical protein QTP70_001432 [Hemibagrus guttatus]|uniref:Ig-like domain-containing protein n=1 Tax=Hemibagrus guttatus TaxID=175788 RepID=A0AAE0QB87_9TELE|nr:hypothetical protein QTP70_001432 [Hemibagrus guttatus]